MAYKEDMKIQKHLCLRDWKIEPSWVLLFSNISGEVLRYYFKDLDWEACKC